MYENEYFAAVLVWLSIVLTPRLLLHWKHNTCHTDFIVENNRCFLCMRSISTLDYWLLTALASNYTDIPNVRLAFNYLLLWESGSYVMHGCFTIFNGFWTSCMLSHFVLAAKVRYNHFSSTRVHYQNCPQLNETQYSVYTIA